jgi:hypothetical protein
VRGYAPHSLFSVTSVLETCSDGPAYGSSNFSTFLWSGRGPSIDPQKRPKISKRLVADGLKWASMRSMRMIFSATLSTKLLTERLIEVHLEVFSRNSMLNNLPISTEDFPERCELVENTTHRPNVDFIAVLYVRNKLGCSISGASPSQLYVV